MIFSMYRFDFGPSILIQYFQLLGQLNYWNNIQNPLLVQFYHIWTWLFQTVKWSLWILRSDNIIVRLPECDECVQSLRRRHQVKYRKHSSHEGCLAFIPQYSIYLGKKKLKLPSQRIHRGIKPYFKPWLRSPFYRISSMWGNMKIFLKVITGIFGMMTEIRISFYLSVLCLCMKPVLHVEWIRTWE